MTLIEYVRDRKGRPFGCVAATGKGKIGYSICHTEDTFNKETGRDIAIGRAQKGKSIEKNLVHSLKDTPDIDTFIGSTKNPSQYKLHEVAKKVKHMKRRVEKYYK